MSIRIIILIILAGSFTGYCQIDTLNQRDENGRKQGYWIYYGKDRPESGYPANGKVEEGNYKDDRKNGVWMRYHIDGKTLKLKGQYLNSRPYGSFEMYYPNGNIRRKGFVTDGNDRYKEYEEYSYYESGTLKEKRTVDSIFNYFESGCLMTITILSEEDIAKCVIVQYYYDSCNVVKDTTIGTIDLCKGIIREQKELALSNSPRAVICYGPPPSVSDPKTVGKPFDPNAYNKVLNNNDEIWQDGEFHQGRLWNGKVYIYDAGGILLKVEVYKNGVYHSDGQL